MKKQFTKRYVLNTDTTKDMNQSESQLALHPQDQQPLSIPALLRGVIQAGITSDTVAVMKDLLAMNERIEERDAEKQYNIAFVKLQSETGKIEATKAVHNSEDKGGGVRYYFAPFEEIMDKVQPLLTHHGFGIEFDSEVAEGRLLAICTLSHVAGHSRSSRFAVRYSKPPGSSDAQGDMSTLSYAKRGALCSRLNIRIGGMDDDARIEDDTDGATINFKQAAELMEWAEELNADIPAMLKWAGADTFENIPEIKYAGLVALLKKKEAGR